MKVTEVGKMKALYKEVKEKVIFGMENMGSKISCPSPSCIAPSVIHICIPFTTVKSNQEIIGES